MCGLASKNCPSGYFFSPTRFQEGVEVVVDRLDRGVEMLAVVGKALLVLLAAAREMRRNIRILDLVFRA